MAAQPSTTPIPARFTWLRSCNQWGVRSTFPLAVGDIVAATATRTETTSLHRVISVVWTDNASVWMARIAKVDAERSENATPANQNEDASEPAVEADECSPAMAITATFADAWPCGRRPIPHVVEATDKDLDWEPTKHEVYYTTNGETLVRAGEQFAIVRTGFKFPLGHASDHRRIVSHNKTRDAIYAGPVATGQIVPGVRYIAGHGYHVIQTFDVQHMQAATIDGVQITHKLVVTNDHTGAGAMRASLVCYVGDDAVGAVAFSRARHVSSNPERWTSDVEAMIETAILKQDEILELLRAAQAHVLTDEDRVWLRRKDVIVKNSAHTLLDAFRAWHESRGKAKPTWGVWSRRLDDRGLRVMRQLLETLGELTQ